MNRKQSALGRRRGTLILALFPLLYFCYVFYIYWTQDIPSSNIEHSGPLNRPPPDAYRFLNFTQEQCETAFPNLTSDIEATVSLGPFALKQAQDTGPLQARVKDGQLYILYSEGQGALTPELLQQRTAALHQIHRAILTSPEPLPDTVFALNIRDQPYGTAWSYSRPAYAASASAMPPISRAFLMPHFSFWSWPLPFIGSVSRAAAAISRIEGSLPFSQKDPRVVWRGMARFNGVHNPTLRQDLLSVTAGTRWADVQALDSYDLESSAQGNMKAATEKGGGSSGSAIMIEDFCRYKYVLYTDGVTYSGRLQFLQMCRSVLLTPPIAWLQYTTHLIRPLFSSDLDLGGKQSWTQSEGIRKAWPTPYGPGEANAVFVAPDWSDLEDTVKWLEEHTDVAAGIATRQRDLFVEQGYLSPAAEVCYWRALIRGWSTVVELEDEGWEDETGISWESFTMGAKT
ncbi:glycosyl transferase family 90-domain-containing protein [Xylariaceae sp. FL1651]|nr:glycosyl transferase family 90-domain-containing protein [Xylariaceae sp. FL1651]